MTILFVDHHDSFVNNLVCWFKRNYHGDVLIVQSSELHKVRIKNLSAVIFSPGPGHPVEYKNSIAFYLGLPKHIPFLGVCLGFQIMLCAHGATLEQVAKIPVHGRQIKLSKAKPSQFLQQDALHGYFVRYNSLGVRVNDIVFCKDIALLAGQGEFAMAVEHVQLPRIGVQFHPESFASPGGEHFMRSFLKLVN